MTSFGVRALRAGFKLVRLKGWVYRGFRGPSRNSGLMESDRYPAKLNPESWSLDGSKLLTIHPPNPSDQHLLFLPGGAYLMEPTILHQWFLIKLAVKLGLSATFIDYPKAPEDTYRTTHELVLKAYCDVTRKYPAKEYILLGDSAGGGLALALAQTLRDKEVQPFPAKTILISPWLDLSLVNREIPQYLPRDPLLPLDGLKFAAELYSGGEDLKNPLLSPLYGEMTDLGRILVLFGTEEIFYPDCQALISKLSNASGSRVDYLKGEGMIHDWILFPLKESRKGFEEITRFIFEK
jgi:monoterpene epsilon-lactone hydrolase